MSDADTLSVVAARCACLPASSMTDDGHCYVPYNQGIEEDENWIEGNNLISLSNSMI